MNITQLKRKVTNILKANNIPKSNWTKSLVKSCNLMTEGFYYTKGNKDWEVNLMYVDRHVNDKIKQHEENRILHKMYDILVNEMDESWFQMDGNSIILNADE